MESMWNRRLIELANIIESYAANTFVFNFFY